MEHESGDEALFLWRFGNAEFDQAAMRLKVDRKPRKLELKPAQVLELLLRHAGEVVTREELMDTVWEGRVVVDNVLSTAVGKLRDALADVDAVQIETVPRAGYRLVGSIERSVSRQRAPSELALHTGGPVPLRPEFRLTQMLGEGGGSEVWLAEGGKNNRRVFKFAADGRRLASLKREATLNRLLRKMLGDDCGVVRIVDWNFAEAPFFIESEFGGESLDQWAERAGRLDEFDIDQRIDLFIRVARIVARAHAIGILHKDIKPANILIDRDADGCWRLRVADFGSATLSNPELLEKLGITAMGMTISDSPDSSPDRGTLMYMAPEVHEGAPASVRGDIYALGIVLYQLVVGDFRRVIAPDWDQEVSDPLLREDIAAATAGDPARRLASVEALIERLESRDERRERARQAERRAAEQRETRRALERARARRPWLWATIGVLAVALVGSVWFSRELLVARNTAESAVERAESINEFLTRLLVQANRRHTGAGRDLTLREALERADDLIEEELQDQPLLELSTRITLAEILAGLGEAELTLEHAERARGLIDELGNELGPDMLAPRYSLAGSLTRISAFEQAGEVLEATDQAAGALLDTGHPAAFQSRSIRGQFHLMQTQPEQALTQAEAASDWLTEYAPDDLRRRFSVASTRAQALVRLQEFEAANAIAAKLLGPEYRAAGVPPGLLAEVRRLRAATLGYLSRYDEAEQAFERALDAAADTFGEDSPEYGATLNEYTAMLGAAGRWDDAARTAAQVTEIACRTAGPETFNCIGARANQGIITYRSGQWQKAHAALTEAAEKFAALTGPQSPPVQLMEHYLARTLIELDRADEARPIAERLDPEKLAAASPGTHWDIRVDALKALIQIHTGERKPGIARLEAAVETLREAEMQDWIVMPLQQHLDEARDVP